jgi:hypothetical protein
VYQSTQLSGLGLSLKPPAWLRNIAAQLAQKTTVTIPTAAGPLTLSPQQAANAARGAQVTYSSGPRPASPIDAANAAVTNEIPGGWLTVAAIGLAAVFILPKLMRGRRRA